MILEQLQMMLQGLVLQVNWKLETIKAVQRKNPKDYHWAGLVTISEMDVEQVRAKLKDCLNGIMQDVVQPSGSETIYGLSLDWFELINGSR